MFTISRRNFIQTAGIVSLGTLLPSPLFAATEALIPSTRRLKISYRTLEVNGRAAKVYGLLDEKDKPGLVFKKGDIFNVSLTNETKEETLIHWHGLTPPWEQDGVPGVTQALLKPKSIYSYNFPLVRGGTNWMHAHTLQEQNLMAAPLIIRENDALDEQEIVILLHDFSFKTPEELLAGLQGGSAHGGHDMSAMGHDMAHMNPDQHAAMMKAMQGSMDMGAGMAMDVNDIEYDAYLANDRTLDDPEVITVETGGRIRLRIINGATSTGFTVDLGALSGELVAVDGMDIVPVNGSTFPMAMAQRIDLRIQLPKEATAWPILMKREGAKEQTGIILALPSAKIKKIPKLSDQKGAALDLTLEQKLVSTTPLADKEPDIDAVYDLTGTMNPFVWAMTLKNPASKVLTVKKGNRVHVTLNNHSMMAHPIHLHGHHFQVIKLNGTALKGAVRDTILIPPHASVTIAFDADHFGKKWAFHCHHLYHMATGMMSFIEYSG